MNLELQVGQHVIFKTFLEAGHITEEYMVEAMVDHLASSGPYAPMWWKYELTDKNGVKRFALGYQVVSSKGKKENC